MAQLPSGTVTFLFTDMVGFTRLWEQHPEAMPAVLACLDVVLRAAVEAHGGFLFNTAGDAFAAVFAQATDALGAALRAQQSLRALEGLAPAAWQRYHQLIAERRAETLAPAELQDLMALGNDAGPDEEGRAELLLKVRMGLHTGGAEARGGNYLGPPVNRAAKLADVAHGGQVLLSRVTQELVQDDLPFGVSLKNLGPHRLKGLDRPEEVFQLVHPNLPRDFPPLQAAPVIPQELSREELLHLLFELHRRLDEQKRHCAFLSVDVAHNSEMKRAGTPLAVEYSFGQFQRWVSQVVERCGGEIQSFAGDGMMGLFPSDAGALRAARQLQAEIDRFNAEHNRLPLPFRIRCGISAGEVAVEAGEAIGHLHSVIIDRAAALQKRAEPGGIQVSGEVAATALMELGPVTPLDEPIGGEPAFAWKRAS